MLAVNDFDGASAGAAALQRIGGLPPGRPAKPVFNAADLGQYCEDLRRFARRRVRDEALAEDAVQDAMVAALVSLPSFQGNSSLKTWLLGILAHKIQDAFRRETRYVRLPASVGGESDHPAAGGDDCVDAAGVAMISERDPVREVSQSRFRASVAEAVERLPSSLRQVFQMQAIDGLSTEDVCHRLGISPANCWVRLHRARKQLSQQLAGHY